MADGPEPSSHLVLARKWRPERFSDLVGQEYVTRTLARRCNSGRIAHAFLFTGIRGVGKTTAARILARCLNCEKGPTPEPCGECAACVEIRQGRALDVVEIDGATYRKIDDARTIIENLSYRPARDRFKIYIIDEAHQLTDQAFNALLKTLEEPPAHIKFILATTEPQKMPETILSRLQRYDFRRIPFAVSLDAPASELARREGIEADDARARDCSRARPTAACATPNGCWRRRSPRSAQRHREPWSRIRWASPAAAAVYRAGRGDSQQGRGASARRPFANCIAAAPIWKGSDAICSKCCATWRSPSCRRRDEALTPLADLPDHEAATCGELAATPELRDLMRLFQLMADAQEQLLRSPYPDLLLEMAWCGWRRWRR